MSESKEMPLEELDALVLSLELELRLADVDSELLELDMLNDSELLELELELEDTDSELELEEAVVEDTLGDEQLVVLRFGGCRSVVNDEVHPVEHHVEADQHELLEGTKRTVREDVAVADGLLVVRIVGFAPTLCEQLDRREYCIVSDLLFIVDRLPVTTLHRTGPCRSDSYLTTHFKPPGALPPFRVEMGACWPCLPFTFVPRDTGLASLVESTSLDTGLPASRAGLSPRLTPR